MLKLVDGGSMKVNGTSQNARKPIINMQTTGYTAIASMGLSAISGYSKNKTIKQTHGYFAGLSIISVLAHLYLAFSRPKKKLIKH
jgi:hypothetical protein